MTHAQLLTRASEVERVVADCDQRLARYRAALEAGTDPALIAGWTAEVNATRAAAQAELRAATGGPHRRMTAEEINTPGGEPRLDPHRAARPDPQDKAIVYREVGLRLTYRPVDNKVVAEAKSSTIMYERLCPEGDLNPHALYGH